MPERVQRALREWQSVHPGESIFLSFHARKYAGPVEVGVAAIDMCATHARIECINARDQGDRRLTGIRLPATLVGLEKR